VGLCRVGLAVPEGLRLMEWRSCMSMDPWLDRLWGAQCSRMEILCMCGFWAWQALGAQPCRVNIMQCCAGFGSLVGKEEIVHGWGARPSEVELLQGYAGLGSLAGKAEIVQGGECSPVKQSSCRAGQA
jgi:hypothetical protein